MDHELFARVGLSAFCCIQGVAQLAIDLNRTHASNPNWTGHARFHVVWQSVTVALLSVVELYLIWTSNVSREMGFYLAIVLVCLSPLGFMAALAARGTYGETLSDPSGIAPWKVTLRGKIYVVDWNLAAVLAAFAAAIALVAIYRG